MNIHDLVICFTSMEEMPVHIDLAQVLGTPIACTNRKSTSS